ncbi:glycosyl transferase [Lampropedia puyangensis]|uniref:Glycosyl transferase n=1 Tax=Lampropedia puyangensis TaxID=1330072 RepID=A0A4S8F2G2_9BURK|nr:glycosyltransferase [Lampropedia puyangensis]THU01500.1 glycosyl transferase [Lampropedia puyangensis]
MLSSTPADAAAMSACATSGKEPHVVASIVSHGHGRLILDLIQQLQALAEPCLRRVIVTLNIEEPELMAQLQHVASASFVLQIIQNTTPKGFGCNHNAALQTALSHPVTSPASHVCILNPDISLLDAHPMAALTQALNTPATALAYPLLVDADGTRQDNERELPSFRKLLLRRLFKRTEQRVDWVSGACMMLRANDWLRLRGFDEQFHMYCEDVDLSLRARRDIGALVRAQTRMAHSAQRASHRQYKHLAWHLQSLWRLWHLPSFRWALRNPSPVIRSAIE